MRLDLYLLKNNITNSRTRAKDLILDNKVLVDGVIVNKPSYDVLNEKVTLIEDFKYISRGGYKLEEAIKCFNLDFKDKVIVDIGASTGGFTDCYLQNGCSFIYSIDVGTLQLDESLRKNPKVCSMEETNFLDISGFDKEIDYYVMDVSFVSITKILPHIKNLGGKKIVTLIKPQFEVGYKGTKTGIIKEKKEHILILSNILEFIRQIGLNVTGLTYSPIKGKSGNIEYLCYIGEKDKSFDIKRIVEEAHEKL